MNPTMLRGKTSEPTRAKATAFARMATAMAFAWLLASCSSLLAPRSIELSQARLQTLLAERLPAQTERVGPFRFRADEPGLTLLPALNRVAVDMAVGIVSDFIPIPTLSGSLRVTQRLRFETSDSTVRLDDVVVERFDVAGLPQTLQRVIDTYARPFAGALLEDRVLYALRPQEIAEMSRHGLRPGSIRVKDTAIEIELVPAARP